MKGFERLLILCRGFAAWDKFDYRGAAETVYRTIDQLNKWRIS